MRSICKTAGLALLLALGTTNVAGAEPSPGVGAQAQPAALAPARKKLLGHLEAAPAVPRHPGPAAGRLQGSDGLHRRREALGGRPPARGDLPVGRRGDEGALEKVRSAMHRPRRRAWRWNGRGPMLQRGAKVARGRLRQRRPDHRHWRCAFPRSRFFGFDRDAGGHHHRPPAGRSRRRRRAHLVRDRRPPVIFRAPAISWWSSWWRAAGGRRPPCRWWPATSAGRWPPTAAGWCWSPAAAIPTCDGRSGRLRRVVFEGGFTRVRCAPAMLAGLIVQARP